MLDQPEQAWFDVHLMHKDIRLVLETARQVSVPVPSTATAGGLLATDRAGATRGATSPPSSRYLARPAGAPAPTARAARSGSPAAGSGGNTA